MIEEPQNGVVPDFIFGTLATDALRVESIQRERRGLFNVAQHDPLDPAPDRAVALTIAVGPDVPADRVAIYWTTDGSLPAGQRGVAENGQALTLDCCSVVWDTLIWGYSSIYAGSIPPLPDGVEVKYTVEAWHSAGDQTWVIGDVEPRVFGFTVDQATVPAWLREAVIYQIFVDRFAPDPEKQWLRPADPLGGFYGGTIQGITAHLDELAELGVTCLWLTPIFPSPSHHGYDATDYGTIDVRLGSLAEFDALIEAAHAHGLRVILDYVANHLSWQHPAFIAARQSTDAGTASWFHFTHWPDRYRSFFGVQEMPQFETDDPGARAYLIDHACEWLRRGADGFRLDYANGPTHAFWSAFRTATRRIKADSVTIGEIVETPQLQRSYTGRMDGCLDFVLLQALRNFFAFGSSSPSEFDRFLAQHLQFFNTDFVLPSFLDNHDMNRFLWIVDGDERRLRIAALCQFTLPGPPIIYYGTEVGLSQQRDVRYPDGSGHPEEARRPMVWGSGQNAQLKDFYRRLIALRRSFGDVWRKSHVPLLVDDQRGLYAYRRGPCVVVFNNSAVAQTVVPTGRPAELILATDDAVVWNGNGAVDLPPFAGACGRENLD